MTAASGALPLIQVNAPAIRRAYQAFQDYGGSLCRLTASWLLLRSSRCLQRSALSWLGVTSGRATCDGASIALKARHYDRRLPASGGRRCIVLALKAALKPPRDSPR